MVSNRNKKKLTRNIRKGFTLVEILLYISLAAFILLSVSVFLSIILEARLKNQTIAEVEQSGAEVIQMFEQTVRNASAINSPANAAVANTASIDVLDGAKDPTVFDLFEGAIRIKEGSAAAINLTSPRVTATNLVFNNLSLNETEGTIRIQFTLTHKNPSGRNEYNYSKTFYGSASLR